MLDVPGLKAAIEEARRIMPNLDVQKQVGARLLAWLTWYAKRPCLRSRLCCSPPYSQLPASTSASSTHSWVVVDPPPPPLPQMASDPQLIFSFQRGSQLIPYDPPRPEEAEQADDDEYAAYYGSGV